jgi:ankyrin repeat protein
MSASDAALRDLISAIVADDAASWRAQLAGAPHLARAAFAVGVMRNAEDGYFVEPVKRWIIAGDSALHFAAAAYRADAVNALLSVGADVHARNRHGHTPLHAAAAGGPGSQTCNPQAQAVTIVALIEGGADPNGTDKRGVTSLHVAVRTRSAEAVRVLLAHGADPTRPNGNGSMPMLLATQNTGRGGSGSSQAKEQQQEIIRLLKNALEAIA